MSTSTIELIDRDAPIFTISVAAELAGMHPQTLRTYDRLGLVRPRRSRGRGRRYSRSDIARLRLVQTLSHDEGINLSGIRRILEMEEAMEHLQKQVSALISELAEARAAQAASAQGRVFTAEASGAVHLGRRMVHHPLQLQGR